jgi:aspartate racemase
MKTIGIIGGSTDLSTIEYYKLINATIREKLGGFHTGEIIINSMDFANSAHFVQHALWDQGGEYLHGKALSLERAGASFIIIAANLWHRVASEVMKGVKIPLLHIADPTAEAIHARKLTKVALLGTKPTMADDFLRNEFAARQIEAIVPSEQEQDTIHHIIFEELTKSVFKEESRKEYLRIIDGLAEQGAQGIILGCTEIPLLIKQEDRPSLPFFDTLTLHAKAAALQALQD